jgi:hypothetical protein
MNAERDLEDRLKPSVPSDESLGYYRPSLRDLRDRLKDSVPSDESLGYYRPSLRDLEDRLKPSAPVMNRWAIISCPSGTANSASPDFKAQFLYMKREGVFHVVDVDL